VRPEQIDDRTMYLSVSRILATVEQRLQAAQEGVPAHRIERLCCVCDHLALALGERHVEGAVLGRAS
jgi:hypothetical protein